MIYCQQKLIYGTSCDHNYADLIRGMALNVLLNLCFYVYLAMFM